MSDTYDPSKSRTFQYHQYEYDRIERTYNVPKVTAERVKSVAKLEKVSANDLVSFAITHVLDAIERGDLVLPKKQTLCRIDYQP